MKQRRQGRHKAEQSNLFHPIRVRPEWPALPVETREEVTKLVARMLRAHHARHAAPSVTGEAEVPHD